MLRRRVLERCWLWWGWKEEDVERGQVRSEGEGALTFEGFPRVLIYATFDVLSQPALLIIGRVPGPYRSSMVPFPQY